MIFIINHFMTYRFIKTLNLLNPIIFLIYLKVFDLNIKVLSCSGPLNSRAISSATAQKRINNGTN